MKREGKSSTLGLSLGLNGGPRPSSRYSRACKDNAKALVALVVADENFKFDKGFGKREVLPSASHSSSSSLHGGGSSSISSSKPRPRSKGLIRSAQCSERLHFLSQTLTEAGANYVCLRCSSSFEDYSSLNTHQRSSSSPACRRPPHNRMMTPKPLTNNPTTHRLFSPLKSDESNLDNYLSSSLISIPEASINHLDGTIHVLNTLDGVYLRRNPKIRTVNRVKLNISGPWQAQEVRNLSSSSNGSASSDRHRSFLSWESFAPVSTKLLKSLSVFPWNEQFLLKRSLSLWLKRSSDEDKKALGEARMSKRLLNLLQLRSAGLVKHSGQKFGGLQRRLPSHFSGEWELERTYICSACSATFHDLEEVMHHKWKDHPYCLVSHWGLNGSIGLPPWGGIYPQCAYRAPNERRLTTTLSSMACSLCSRRFQDVDNFYVHVLGCGDRIGSLESGGSSSSSSLSSSSSSTSSWSRKNRRKRSSGVLRSFNGKSIEEHRQVERERRKRRLEAFSKPRPLSQRLTTLRSRSTLLNNNNHAGIRNKNPSTSPQLRSSSSSTNTPAPALPPPHSPSITIVSNEPEAIRDVFNPDELYVKSLLSEIISDALSGGGRGNARKRKGGPQMSQRPRQRLRTSSRRKTLINTTKRGGAEENFNSASSSSSSGNSIQRRKSARCRRRILGFDASEDSSSTSVSSLSSTASSSSTSNSPSVVPAFFARKSSPDEVFFAVKSSPISQNSVGHISESDESLPSEFLLDESSDASSSSSRNNEFLRVSEAPRRVDDTLPSSQDSTHPHPKASAAAATSSSNLSHHHHPRIHVEQEGCNISLFSL